MAKNPSDTELMLALSQKYNSEDEIQRNLNLILNTKAGICYGVNLHGPIGTICVGRSVAAPGYRFNLYDYPFHRLTLIIKGQAKIHIRGKSYIADPGCIYYFSPKHSGTMENNLDKQIELTYIHFTGTEINNLFKNASESNANVWPIKNPIKIQSLFEAILEDCTQNAEFSQFTCDSYLKILLKKLNYMILDKKHHPSPARLKYLECRNYINNNFSSILSLEDISNKCYINSIYLCRLFKKYAGISPMAYVTKLKMNKAVLMLIQTDYSIKQISLKLSYESPYYFSTIFKKTYGISPKFYRESH